MASEEPRRRSELCGQSSLQLVQRCGDSNETGLQPPGLREGIFRRVTDDQVIEDADIDELQGFAQATGQELVGLGRFCNSAGVIVVHDDRGGVGIEYYTDYFARVDGSAVDRSAEEDLGAYEPMAIVEQ